MFKAWRIDPDGIKVVADPLERLPRDREDRLATRVQDLRQSHSSALWPPGHPWTLNAPGPGLQEKSPGPLHLSVSCHPYFYPFKKKMNLPFKSQKIHLQINFATLCFQG